MNIALEESITRIVADPDEINHDKHAPCGIEVEVPGFQGNPTEGKPTQVFIEVYEGNLQVHVWDGKSENPHTHIIEAIDRT